MRRKDTDVLFYTNSFTKHYIRFICTIVTSKGQWGNGIRQYWRKFLFVVCSCVNYQTMVNFIEFLTAPQNKQIHIMVMNQTFILEQVTRAWLYYRASTEDRVKASIAHFTFFQRKLTPAAFEHIYNKNGITIWEQQFKDNLLTIKLDYGRFYRKEGLMAISLNLGTLRVYSISFWMDFDSNKQLALWIGSIQGSKGELDVIRSLTKCFYGYRPKNLMIHAVQSLTRALQIKNIFAVSNYGSYVNTRIRKNRKLKTSLDKFWMEIGGMVSTDARFFKLPIIEHRKQNEEIPAHKRNLYRKRFALLDNVDETIKDVMNKICH
ncbi:hypothetical protein SAMN05660742_102117 [Propionispira arboris]|uniref:DUF535 domain-containing protein n=1 Tax=Propionispira arboris TaxID=84035 RepID=A0A1H6V9Q9_9FIRM|nr:DUF535 family protein [Propionispira arboris]SEI97005.1 hypothetical protein SAMN05660742_102117 [Propionispira arboris]